MNTKTYDRNTSKRLALVADEDYRHIRYVPIIAASPDIEEVNLSTLKLLHQAAYGVVGKPNPDFDPVEWSRYSEMVET